MVKISSDNTVRVTITDNSANMNLCSNNSAAATNTVKLNSNTINTNKLDVSNNQAKYFSDLAQGYADEAKDWANKLGNTVDGVEYSSKHYALEAKEQAETAESWAEQAIAGQIQADWEETDPESKAYIHNKPQNISQFNNDAGYLTEHQDITAYALKSEIPTDNNQLLNSAGYQNANQVDSIIESKNYATNTNLAKTLNKSQLTNCITEIPQRIKLELNNGTLTLKAGSVVTIPNGFEEDGTTPKFDYVTIDEDISYSESSVEQGGMTRYTLMYKDNGVWKIKSLFNGISGNSSTTLQGNYVFYNTQTNKVSTQWTDAGIGTFSYQNIPFPICKITSGEYQIYNKIDQTFNGMGYIGSTFWVDKGVKALIPNGRNEDGTLRNIEITTNRAAIYTYTTDFNGYLCLMSDGRLSLDDKTWWTYNKAANYFMHDSNKFVAAWIARAVVSNGKITSMKPLQTVDILKRSDVYELSGIGKPANKFINLTIGADGANYVAPANGYFCFDLSPTIANPGINYGMLQSMNTATRVSSFANTSVGKVGNILPVKKGEKIIYRYFCNNANHNLYFVYAEGEV